MPALDAFKSLVFKVHLKPAPRTQSESNAVFQALQNIGPISTFQIDHHSPWKSTTAPEVNGNEHFDHTLANLVFSHNTKNVDDLRNGRGKKQQFTITSNANIPSAKVKDPYNVFGLKSRKPELEPRDIECTITPLVDPRAWKSKDPSVPLPIGLKRHNGYSDPFAVDRGSVFAEILAKTDCPSGLIHGLLPRLEDEHRIPSHPLVSNTKENERQESSKEQFSEGKLQESQAQKSSRRTKYVSLDLNTLQHDLDETREECGKDSVAPHDEFAQFRQFSLMGLYREATSEKGASKSE